MSKAAARFAALTSPTKIHRLHSSNENTLPGSHPGFNHRRARFLAGPQEYARTLVSGSTDIMAIFQCLSFHQAISDRFYPSTQWGYRHDSTTIMRTC